MLATILAEINGTLGIGACLGAAIAAIVAALVTANCGLGEGVALFAVIVCVLSLFL